MQTIKQAIITQAFFACLGILDGLMIMATFPLFGQLPPYAASFLMITEAAAMMAANGYLCMTVFGRIIRHW